ncbi:MAG: AbrB/MazE/SpoVT family DNA-binding domain-containing protein [Defluviitaleaceae bacterium]|nr:AbrB/MazE/SpoVT family DNA-binding domain-containing protein [Defluviitaleaceae bacterium]
MKATGVVRQVDELGRLVLPVELRKTKGIEKGTPVEFFVDDDSIVLKRYEIACRFTGSAEDLLEYKGHKVSKQAIRELAKLLESSEE